MKIVVIGGTGLIGSRLVTNLRAHAHKSVAASPQSGVNSVTCDGLADALQSNVEHVCRLCRGGQNAEQFLAQRRVGTYLARRNPPIFLPEGGGVIRHP